MCGPAGCYMIRLLDIKEDFKIKFCELFRLMQIARSKSSTPGQRLELEQGIPRVMTELELLLPVDWNTPVAHYFVCSTLDNILDCGASPETTRDRTFSYFHRTPGVR